MNKHTAGPWKLGEFDEYLGYDCMTGGVRVGPAVLDGGDYGQKRCAEIDPEAKARMLADAALIAASPDLLTALEEAVLHIKAISGRDNSCDPPEDVSYYEEIIFKARGEA